jgi:hypothetical protein
VKIVEGRAQKAVRGQWEGASVGVAEAAVRRSAASARCLRIIA